MNSIDRLSQLSQDPKAFSFVLKDIQMNNPDGFAAVDSCLERCVDLGALDLEKTANHLADYPHGELPFLISEGKDREAADYIALRDLDKDKAAELEDMMDM